MDTIKALLGILVVLGITYLGLIVVIRALSFIFSPVAAYVKKHGVLKYFYPVLFSVLGLVFVGKTLVFPQGYCKSQLKYLSDDDFKVIAMSEVDPLRAKDPEAIAAWRARRLDPALYNVVRGEDISFFGRLFDQQEIWVEAFAPNGLNGRQEFFFDVCGRSLH
ncbi:MAG: hypothetical protein ACYC3N_08440 [Halothiobacillus sp.]